ncbi:MAG: hypothetical protein LH469_01395 [Frankiaceae bacterium]|nr:hypothetical protein [Frankiaceae bacterium]
MDVRVRDVHGNECSGAVQRPSVLTALIGTAAATTIAVRTNRSRDTQDAALLGRDQARLGQAALRLILRDLS